MRDRAGVAIRIACIFGSIASSTLAAPQWNTAVSTGIAGVSEGPSFWDRTQFFGGVRGDVLLLRDGPRSVGFGPSLEISTAGFSDLRAGGGTPLLLPLGDLLGVSIEPGAYFRSSESGASAGLSARAWFGIQTYNYDGNYAPRGGLSVGYARDVGGSEQHALIIAAQIDGLVLALPVLMLYESLRGHPDDD